MKKNKKERFIKIEKDSKKDKRNKIIVNCITGIRTLGTLVMVPIYQIYGAVTTAVAAGLFFLTDFIDGKLARKLHVQTFFGSLLDGLSDKAFGIVCLFILALQNNIFLLPILLEVTILAVNFHSMQKGNNVKSSILGKIKTGILTGTLIGGFLCLEAPTVKEILNYINIKSLDTLLNNDVHSILNVVATPLILSEAVVIADYELSSIKQDRKRINELEKEITQIENKKALLKQEKDNLKIKKRELKPKEEIMYDLFDTEFYLENKDGGIKKLLFKETKEK